MTLPPFWRPPHASAPESAPLAALGVEALAALSVPTPVLGRSGSVHLVPPPTIRQAVEIRAAMRGADRGDPDDTVLLRCLLLGWLGNEVAAVLADLAPERLGELVESILDAGVQSATEQPGAVPPAGPAPAGPPPSLCTVLGDYCQIYGGEPWAVYDRTPWAWWLEMVQRMESAAARDLVRWARVEMIGAGGKAASRALADLSALARGAPRPGTPQADPGPVDPATYTPPPEVLAGRARLREIMGAGGASTSAGA